MVAECEGFVSLPPAQAIKTSIFDLELGEKAGIIYSSQMTLDGELHLTVDEVFNLGQGQSFHIVDADAISGSFSKLSWDFPNGLTPALRSANDGMWVDIVPEPAGMTLLLAASATLLLRRGRSVPVD